MVECRPAVERTKPLDDKWERSTVCRDVATKQLADDVCIVLLLTDGSNAPHPRIDQHLSSAKAIKRPIVAVRDAGMRRRGRRRLESEGRVWNNGPGTIC